MNIGPYLTLSALGVFAITPQFVLKAARSIADYAGYTPTPARIMDYEITDRPGKPVYQEFITVEIMANGHDIFDLSVRMSDGEIFDFTGCYVFD